MPFDLPAIEAELARVPLVSPYPADLSIAIVADVFRDSQHTAPIPAELVASLAASTGTTFDELLGALAHLVRHTSLRAATVDALRRDREHSPPVVLKLFFDAVKPLAAEMVRSNAFRREEFLRKWVLAVGGTVQGETAEQSRQRVEQLDYAKTLAEFDRAESARRAEVERKQALEAAAAAEAAARGWRE